MSTQAFARKNDPQTSHEAAESVRNITKVQQQILDILRAFGQMTDEELVGAYRQHGRIPASDSGIRSRRSELVRMGLVGDAGIGETRSRRPCRLWRAIPEKGQEI